MIIGFPCDQFAHQEPGTDSEIAQFCELNFGVTFPLMKKINVNGDDAHPVYKYLKKASKGFLGNAIKWNFTKFLISKDGSKVERFSPTTKPESLDRRVADLLAE
jgi:glutathione peroxidase